MLKDVEQMLEEMLRLGHYTELYQFNLKCKVLDLKIKVERLKRDGILDA